MFETLFLLQVRLTERVVCGVAKRFCERPVERSREPASWVYGYCSRLLSSRGWPSVVTVAAERSRARLGRVFLAQLGAAVVSQTSAEARLWRGCVDGCIDRIRHGQRWAGSGGKRVHGARARGGDEPIGTRRPVWHRGQRFDSCARGSSGRWSEVGWAGGSGCSFVSPMS